MNLYLIRHGKTYANEAHLYCGSTDLPLTPQGIEELKQLRYEISQAAYLTSGMLRTEIDFNALQSLFMNEVFLPGKPQLEAGDVRRFHVFPAGSRAMLVPKSSRALSYQFFTGTESGLLEKTCVGIDGMDGYALEWDYSDFSGLDGKLFPRHIVARVPAKNFSLDMKLSRMSVSADWESSSALSSKYRRMELRELLDMLVK